MVVVGVPGNERQMNQDERNLIKKAMRDSVLFVGWLKLSSVVLCIILCVLVYIYSTGPVSMAIQIMLAIMIPLDILHSLVLFLGVLQEKPEVLGIGMWLCIVLALYNTLVGLIGLVYFIRIGHIVWHFILAACFGCQALSIITVFCYDFLIISAYKTCIQEDYRLAIFIQTDI